MTTTTPVAPEPLHFVGRTSSLLRCLLQSVLLWPVVSWFCYPFTRRGEHLIPRAPVVFIANHASHADTAVILRALPPSIRRRTVVAAAQDHFWRIPTLGAFVSLLTGAFPFPRSGCQGLHRAERMLSRGYNVLLYPEGTRSNGVALGEFQQGATILAGRGATIVPVGLYGSGEVLPKGHKRPRRRSVAIVFGEAVPPTDTTHSEHLRQRVRVAAENARHLTTNAAPDLFQRARSFACSSAATKALFVWAFAEALLWPIVPDFALVPLILVAPARALAFVCVVTAGSVAGGVVALLLGGAAAGQSLLGVAPLVTDRMIAVAGQVLADEGGGALLGQPLSGIPYKVFALQAAPAGVGLADYVMMSIVARGARFAAVALVSVVMARILRALWERAFGFFLVLYCVSFATGLTLFVASWS